MDVDDLIETAAVAQRHYKDGRSKVEIAEEFGISRFKVSRLLKEAIRTGIVTITVTMPEGVDGDLSLRLRDRYGLERAVVVWPDGDDPVAVRQAIGKAAAQVLMERVTDRDVLGIANGRTMNAMVGHVTRLPPCEVVQLTGMAMSVEDDTVELVRRVSAISGGTPHAIFAPMTLATRATAEAIKSDPAIIQAIRLFPRVTIAVVPVGSWSPPDSQYYWGLDDEEREALLARGVHADIAGGLLDENGEAIDDMVERTIGMSVRELRTVPHLVVIAGGVPKAGAIRAVLRARLATTLVTDIGAARELLKD